MPAVAARFVGRAGAEAVDEELDEELELDEVELDELELELDEVELDEVELEELELELEEPDELEDDVAGADDRDEDEDADASSPPLPPQPASIARHPMIVSSRIVANLEWCANIVNFLKYSIRLERIICTPPCIHIVAK